MASHLAYELNRKGVTVPSADILIMATAVENGCSLLHADRDFDLMAGQGIGLPSHKVRNLLSDAL
jgi:predicted nucleic acid-binding protein